MTGAWVGLLFGAGLLTVIVSWRTTAPPPPLVAALHRVPGYEPLQVAGTGLRAAAKPLLDLVARLFGGRSALAQRLQQADDTGGVERYLLLQTARAGGFAGATLLWLLLAQSVDNSAAGLILLVLAAASGLLLGDHLLTRRVVRRREATAEQFPVAAQLLALLLAAGAQPAEAIERVGRSIGGPLGRDFQAAANRVHGGQRFAVAMRELANCTDQPAIERFVSAFISAVERGSPLSELMRAQAMDAAAESHRQLMTAAGRRDIAMLVPVVFAVLPAVVVVVLLPGAVQLGLV